MACDTSSPKTGDLRFLSLLPYLLWSDLDPVDDLEDDVQSLCWLRFEALLDGFRNPSNVLDGDCFNWPISLP